MLLLQGLLQLRHVALQLQVFVPGIFHLLLTKEMLWFLAVLASRSPRHTCAPDHSWLRQGQRKTALQVWWAGERDMGCLLTHALTLAICPVPSYIPGDTLVPRPGRKGPAPHQMDRSSGNSDILELLQIREKPYRLL